MFTRRGRDGEASARSGNVTDGARLYNRLRELNVNPDHSRENTRNEGKGGGKSSVRGVTGERSEWVWGVEERTFVQSGTGRGEKQRT